MIETVYYFWMHYVCMITHSRIPIHRCAAGFLSLSKATTRRIATITIAHCFAETADPCYKEYAVTCKVKVPPMACEGGCCDDQFAEAVRKTKFLSCLNLPSSPESSVLDDYWISRRRISVDKYPPWIEWPVAHVQPVSARWPRSYTCCCMFLPLYFFDLFSWAPL